MVQEEEQPSASPGRSSPYRIQIHGSLDERWTDWFSSIDMVIAHSSDPIPLTTLNCPAIDQAKLRGILNKIWDLNLSLITVQRISDPEREW